MRMLGRKGSPESSKYRLSAAEAKASAVSPSEGTVKRSWWQQLVGSGVSWHERVPKSRGWGLRGTGETVVVQPALEWRGTSVQLCGLWPFSAGSGMPPIGTPLGTRLGTGATICADPMAWFTRQLTTTPSGFVLGRPAVGKSTLIRRMLTGMHHAGTIPLVLGDTKPDYVRLMGRLGGRMVAVGDVRTDAEGNVTTGHINPLDLMGAHGPVAELPKEVRRWAVEHLMTQQSSVLRGLLEIANQGKPLSGEEASLISAGLHLLQVGPDREPLPGPAPTVRDLLELFEAPEPHPRLMAKVLARDKDEWDSATRTLRLLLMALLEDGQFGPVFDGPTEHLDLTRPGGFDMSEVDDDDVALQAAVQLACWAYGTTTVALATKMADLGVGPRRHYMLVMDELWKMLRAADVLVYRVDKLTRINRELGVGQIMATHTMDDLRLSSEELTRVAWGFVERSAMVFLGGLVGREFGNLKDVFALSGPEQAYLTDWAEEGGMDPTTGQGTGPRGRGKFLLKLGKRPGIPIQLKLTEMERWVNDTNRRWETLRMSGAADGDDASEVA